MTCYAYDDFTVFDLRSLQNDQQDYMYQLKATNSNGSLAFTDLYAFNFCKPAASSCHDGHKVWGYKVHNNTEIGVSCSHLSGEDLLSSFEQKTIVDEVANTRHI